jgi:hypothetical protein
MSLSPREHCLPNKSGTLGCLARLSALRHCRCGFPQSSMFIFKAFLLRISCHAPFGYLPFFLGSRRPPGAFYSDAQTRQARSSKPLAFFVGFLCSLAFFHLSWFLFSATLTALLVSFTQHISATHKRVFYSLCPGKYS